MGRCTVIRWAFAGGLLFVIGCAVPRNFGPFGSARTADEPKTAAPDASAARNPFKKSTDADSTADSEDPADSDGKGASTSSSSGSKKSQSKTAALDPELQKLIEEELQHEPPQDRERLRKEWSNFDPTFIRQLVDTHRLSREVAEGNDKKPVRLASGDNKSAAQGDDFDDLDAAPASPVKKSAVSDGPATGGGPSPSDSGRARLNDSDQFGANNNDGQKNLPILIRPGVSSPGGHVASRDSSQRKPADDPTTLAAAGSDSSDPFSDSDSGGGVKKMPAKPGSGDFKSSDPNDPVIQPGLASSADVLAQLGRSSKSARTADAGGVTPASATSSGQPVQLELPMDIPDGNSPAALQTGAKSKTPADSSSPPGAAQPSSLAQLGGRLMGAINPGQNPTAGKTPPKNVNWQNELQKILAAAASEVAHTSAGNKDSEKLNYIEKQVHLRMLYLLAGQSARSLEPIPGLEAADQEFWQQVFWAISNYFDASTIADPSDRATQAITSLRTAVQRLQEKSKLELHNVAFCHKIVNYGNYERFKRDEFTAGQPVLLYAEVTNFKSEPMPDGPYRTILKSTVEIFDSRKTLVKSHSFAPTEDVCSSPRRDYYNSYEFEIPQRIGLGPHTLKLTVEDQLSQKVATYTVNFTVK
jgi:hypothetical protein